MKNRFTLLLSGFLLSFSLFASEKYDIPKEIESQAKAVIDYLNNKDYPELFTDKKYSIRIKKIIVTDIDNDGLNEAVVLYQPHFRQSPTIILFKLSNTRKTYKASRIYEGLAPGPIIPVSGSTIDSHTLRVALDLVAESESGEKIPDPIQVVEMGRAKGMNGFVQYNKFFHIDFRKGLGSYIDMSHLPDIPENCEKFEFSNVNDIAIGELNDKESKTYIAALTGSSIYLYEINKINEKGYLDKQLFTIPLPHGFKSFVSTFNVKKGNKIKYLTTNGKEQVLSMGNAKPLPNNTFQPTAESGG